MTPRLTLGLLRTTVGLSSWLAPSFVVRFFGLGPEPDRFVTRLFGSRELTLALALLAAPAAAVAPVAAIGVAIDTADAVAGFDEGRRGSLGTRGLVLGAGGAVVFAALGALALRDARASLS